MRFSVSRGFTPEAAQRIVDRTCRVAKLIQESLTQHAVSLPSEFHCSTCFTVEAVEGVIHTLNGTVAGHSIADLVFALADAEVADDLHRRLLDESLVVELPTAGLADWWGIGDTISEDFPLVAHVARPAYCDDAFVPVFAEAADITNKVVKVASTYGL